MYDKPTALLYAAPVRTELMGMEEVRKDLRRRLQLANPERDPKKPEDEQPEEVHTVITQRGKLGGVLVGPEWYRKAREALGEPTDL